VLIENNIRIGDGSGFDIKIGFSRIFLILSFCDNFSGLLKRF
jgi:hypothetical protein